MTKDRWISETANHILDKGNTSYYYLIEMYETYKTDICSGGRLAFIHNHTEGGCVK